ncbi:ubiquitin-like domain-containing protein [Paenibacillus sp. MBLB4367]|uniref:ubiquitin-like domain-containing protein n=1 Tax=Paenibacillus sp. MBLB4367 TaxID=3384767 RepID=UPI0039081208
MTFALRWKHENVRTVSIIALISIALTFMFFMLLYGTATKSVSVVVDGKETVVKTKQWTLQRLLDEQAISIGEHDRVSATLDTRIKSGDKFTIDFTSPIVVTADGETKTLYTTGKTVGSALQEFNISLGAEDKISPELDTGVAASMPIKIVRVKKEIEEHAVPIAFETETKKDANLLKGKEETVQEGKEGTKLVQKQKVYEDGSLVEENVVAETVQAASVNKVVAIGTKVPVVLPLSASSPTVDDVTKNGVQFGYKQIIKNVTLTAYSADNGNKTSKDPYYGMTYTGTTATEGRTIAVDKSIIPLGWWVYIEGLGFRRAEDIGSAVKGNKIDVFFDSEDYANKFGMKRGYTIYVIGPKKPSTD